MIDDWQNLFNKCLTPKERHLIPDLLSNREDFCDILFFLLSKDSKNKFGIPYYNFDDVVLIALLAASRSKQNISSLKEEILFELNNKNTKIVLAVLNLIPRFQLLKSDINYIFECFKNQTDYELKMEFQKIMKLDIYLHELKNSLNIVNESKKEILKYFEEDEKLSYLEIIDLRNEKWSRDLYTISVLNSCFSADIENMKCKNDYCLIEIDLSSGQDIPNDVLVILDLAKEDLKISFHK